MFRALWPRLPSPILIENYWDRVSVLETREYNPPPNLPPPSPIHYLLLSILISLIFDLNLSFVIRFLSFLHMQSIHVNVLFS